jgi:hypothetical protein
MELFAWRQPAITANDKVLGLFSDSRVFQQRIQQGAPIDVFTSAAKAENFPSVKWFLEVVGNLPTLH